MSARAPTVWWRFRLSRARLLTLTSLIITAGYAVALASFEEQPLAGVDDSVAKMVARQVVVTTFARLLVIAATFWLVLWRSRAGYGLAIFIGVATLVLFAVAAAAAQDSGPSDVPLWLQLIGAAASLAMVLGGVVSWRQAR